MTLNSSGLDFSGLDFSSQRLRGHSFRGRSFRGQDLRGADFSRADLRGVDFSRAQLNRANFTGAKTGLLPLYQRLGLAIALLLTLLSGGLAYLLCGLGLMLATAEGSGHLEVAMPLLNQTLRVAVPPISAVVLPLFTGLLSLVLLVGLRVGVERCQKLLLTILVIVTVLVSMILGSYADWGLALAQMGLGLAIAVGLAQILGTLVVVAELLNGPVAGCSVAAIAFGVFWVAAQGVHTQLGIPINPGFGAGAIVGLPWVALGLGLVWAWRSTPPTGAHAPYGLIRQGAVALVARWGTRFMGADLTEADFGEASLPHSDWRGATLTRTRFRGSERLEEARVEGTLLDHPLVLPLVVSGQGRGLGLVEVNLQGADLSEADLRSANLRDAILSQANLEGANLEAANLTRVNAIQTNFRRAQLTGAYLTDWNVDASTQLEAVDCDYVYAREGTSGPTVRLPAQGIWTPGEFSRRFTVRDQDQVSLFELDSLRTTLRTIPVADAAGTSAQPSGEATINPLEVLASLMVLVRLAIADGQLEEPERELLNEALQALDLPAEITVERLLDDRTSLDTLFGQINSPIIREKVYQSAYLMARVDGSLESTEEELLHRIQTRLSLSTSQVEKLHALVDEAQSLSIAEQVEAITDPNQREAAVNTNIRLMSVMHAVSGAMPIPGFSIVTHLMIYKDQVELVQKIGRIWGYPADYQSPALNQALFGTLGATAARVALANVALLVPGWGSVIGASTAFSMTWAIGELTQKFFASGCNLDEASLTDQFTNAKQLGRQVFQEYQAKIAAQQQAMLAGLSTLQQRWQTGQLSQQDCLQQLRELLSKGSEHNSTNSCLETRAE